MTQLFPLATVSLQACAALCAIYAQQWLTALYWGSAALVNLAVILKGQ